MFGAGEAVKVLQGAYLAPAASEGRAVRSAVVSHLLEVGSRRGLSGRLEVLTVTVL